MGTFRRRREWLVWRTEFVVGLHEVSAVVLSKKGLRIYTIGGFLTTNEVTKHFHIRIRLQTK